VTAPANISALISRILLSSLSLARFIRKTPLRLHHLHTPLLI
jgi:hypothetical protein